MSVPGRFGYTSFGIDPINTGAGQLLGSTIIDTANYAAAFRFTAQTTQDIKGVYINWYAVNALARVTVKIETIDGTTGKPNGIYDAAAHLDTFAPTVGPSWQQVAFAATPDTGLVVGNEYAVTILVTTGGSSYARLSSPWGSSSTGIGCYPTTVLTSTDYAGGTWIETTGPKKNPNCILILEDDSLVTWGMSSVGLVTSYNLYETYACGMKFIVPTGSSFLVDGYSVYNLGKNGTPAGNLIIKIWNSSDAVVAGTTVTIDKESISTYGGAGYQLICRMLPATVTLAAGTYKMILSSPDSGASTCWQLKPLIHYSSAFVPTGFIFTKCADYTGTPPTWVETDVTYQAPLALILNDIQISAGSGGSLIYGDRTGGKY